MWAHCCQIFQFFKTNKCRFLCDMSWFKCSTIECSLCARPCPRSWECNSGHNQQNSVSLKLIFSSPVCGLRANPTSPWLRKSPLLSGQVSFGTYMCTSRGRPPATPRATQYTAQKLTSSERSVGAQGSLPSHLDWELLQDRKYIFFFFLNLSLNLQPHKRSWPDIGTL